MKFTVTLAPASGRHVKVNWATADGTATAGADYTARQRTVTFAPGETTKTIDIAVLGDTTNEENETLKVVLSNPIGIPPATWSTAGRRDDRRQERAAVALDQRHDSRREGEGANFTVTLAGTTLRTVTVGFNTVDGDGEGRIGLLRSRRLALVRAGREVEDDHGHRARRRGRRARRGLLRRHRRPGERDDHEEPRRGDDRGERPGPDPPIVTTRDDPHDRHAARSPSRPSVLVPRMILGPRTVSVGANGIARMQVTCQKVSPIGCAGSVELERAAKPLLKLGKKTFTVKKGPRATRRSS